MYREVTTLVFQYKEIECEAKEEGEDDGIFDPILSAAGPVRIMPTMLMRPNQPIIFPAVREETP